MSDATLVRRVDEATGLELSLYPMLFGNVRLVVGEPGSPAWDRGWCYHARHLAGAVGDVLGWGGEGPTPPGPWYRDLQTDERRQEFA